jgi:hypothetical protein
MPQPLYPQGKIPSYPLDSRLGGPQSRSGRGGEEKKPEPLLGLEPPDHPAHSPALYHWAIPTPENRSTRRKWCPSATLCAGNPTRTSYDLNRPSVIRILHLITHRVMARHTGREGKREINMSVLMFPECLKGGCCIIY